MQDSEIDDETALTLALVASEEEHKRDSARRAIRDTLENDFLYALRLQEEENARQRTSEPGSSNSQPTPASKNRFSEIFGTVLKARNDDRRGLRRAPLGIERRFRPWNPDENCCICHQRLPIIDNKIVWSQHPFWKTKVCRTHYEDGTERCASCERLKAVDENWLRLEDDRQICNDCSKTDLMDNNSVQSLYDNVLQFFASLDLTLPSKPPLMLVNKQALNDSAPLGGGGHHGSEGFTRGMTFSEESWVVRRRVNRLGRFLDRDSGPPPAEQRQRHVTVIMVLNGLPRLLTGSILAHEVMHAYLKLKTDTRLPPKVEEGLCQLMGYLWIEKQTPKHPFEVKFCSFVASQIRDHTSPVYGDGFRAAFEWFQSIGLVDLINHIKLTGQFPEQ